MTSHLLTAGEAARTIGVSTAAISRAIKTGRLTYVERTTRGYLIDPNTLFHVFRGRRLARANGEAGGVEDAGDLTAEVMALRIANARLESDLTNARALLHVERQRAETAERDREAWRQMSEWLVPDKRTKSEPGLQTPAPVKDQASKLP